MYIICLLRESERDKREITDEEKKKERRRRRGGGGRGGAAAIEKEGEVKEDRYFHL